MPVTTRLSRSALAIICASALLAGCSLLDTSEGRDTVITVMANVTDKSSMSSVVTALHRQNADMHVSVVYADTTRPPSRRSNATTCWRIWPCAASAGPFRKASDP
ncbi:hypothetical protein OHT76_37925 [Streptomyces sp. NBC_00287]|uniref:hypothetical protein n=1 Tax=Streptomyces sp. NBC_00287 TaxID=2975702 RepID=UPI002E2917B4|nr:hypothetical protein [Streptomyces sp. NBC_00287]